ncbi:MAG: Sporulation stage protein [Clostridia bacterium]|jgi:stage III sporulation protein AF|nr:Sporulation stage protein [Clostridia bacterium]
MKEYMQMFIWIMLFVIVIEMIFPDSSYKKYIKLVLGCIIIYTLIKPVVQVIHVQGKTYDDYVAYYQKELSKNIDYENGALDYEEQLRAQQEILKSAYEESIKHRVESEVEVEVEKVEIEWGKDESHQQIEKLYLLIGARTDGEDGKITIPSIKIGEKSDTLSGDEEKLKIKIKTCLENFYNVQDRNIYITVQKN